MIKGGKGGGNTNKHGLRAETIIYDKFLKNFNNIENFISNYSKNSSNIIIGKKNDIYKHKDSGLIYDQNLIDSINYKPQPDIYIYNPKNKKLWIIEIKNQDIAGTGWEKMEFGIYGYKNDTYKRIFKNLNVNVEGILVGNNWDKIHYFKDVKKYIERIYKKKLYNFNEIDELINLIKKNS